MYLDMLTLYLRKDKANYKPVIIFPHRLHSYVKFMYSAPRVQWLVGPLLFHISQINLFLECEDNIIFHFLCKRYVFCNHRTVKKIRWYKNDHMKANIALARNFPSRPFVPKGRILKNWEVAAERF